MKKNKNLNTDVPGELHNNLDQEMQSFLRQKKFSQEKISEFRFLRHLITDHYPKVEYSFNPFFTELLINRLSLKTINNGSIDISYVLSLFLKKVLISTLFIVFFLVVYAYLTHGSISELLIMNPEKLNDSKFISSILFDH